MGHLDNILPDGWSRPPGYSQGVLHGGSRTLAIAGQVGKDERTGEMPEGFGAQWAAALANVAAVVEAAGGKPSDITAMRIYVTSIDAYREAGPELPDGYTAALGKHFPAMTLVEVTGLLEPAALVEIDAQAILG